MGQYQQDKDFTAKNPAGKIHHNWRCICPLGFAQYHPWSVGIAPLQRAWHCPIVACLALPHCSVVGIAPFKRMSHGKVSGQICCYFGSVVLFSMNSKRHFVWMALPHWRVTGIAPFKGVPHTNFFPKPKTHILRNFKPRLRFKWLLLDAMMHEIEVWRVQQDCRSENPP